MRFGGHACRPRSQPPDSVRRVRLCHHHPLRTCDGWVIGHVQTDDQFAAACRLFNREDLLDDDTWKSAAKRIERNGEMWRALGAKATTMTRAEVLARAESEGVAIGSIYTLEEFFEDPQVRSSDVYVDHEDPEFGVIRQMNFPVRFGLSTVQVEARARTPMPRFNTIVWNSTCLVEKLRQRPAAAQVPQFDLRRTALAE
nr:CoA transferase [Burkholderia sp. IMCC1007]